MNNTIEQQLYNEIENTGGNDVIHGTFLIDVDKAANNCFKVLEEHCIKFNKWCLDNYSFNYNGNVWSNDNEDTLEFINYTNEELFQLYINQLPNE